MINVHLDQHATLDEWRPIARKLIAAQIKPHEVNWNYTRYNDLFKDSGQTIDELKITNDTKIRVSKAFMSLAEYALCHNDEQRFALMYHLLWRHQYEKKLTNNLAEPDVALANNMAKSVGRDRHKMRAFVRFRALHLKDINSTDTSEFKQLPTSLTEQSPLHDNAIYVSWFEPEHYSVKLNIPFFKKRFYNMNWSILTPYISIHWLNKQLTIREGSDKQQAPQQDSYEAYWQVYYASIFNPARLKVNAMCNEMPKKYWKNLPEAKLIPQLINHSNDVTKAMIDKPATEPANITDKKFDREKWLQKNRNN